jgi:hypothetical protein
VRLPNQLAAVPWSATHCAFAFGCAQPLDLIPESNRIAGSDGIHWSASAHSIASVLALNQHTAAQRLVSVCRTPAAFSRGHVLVFDHIKVAYDRISIESDSGLSAPGQMQHLIKTSGYRHDTRSKTFLIRRR